MKKDVLKNELIWQSEDKKVTAVTFYERRNRKMSGRYLDKRKAENAYKWRLTVCYFVRHGSCFLTGLNKRKDKVQEYQSGARVIGASRPKNPDERLF
jgi:hypothetical protein